MGAVPGSSFFREPVNHLIRLHFAKKDETLLDALNRLECLREKIKPKELRKEIRHGRPKRRARGGFATTSSPPAGISPHPELEPARIPHCRSASRSELDRCGIPHSASARPALLGH